MNTAAMSTPKQQPPRDIGRRRVRLPVVQEKTGLKKTAIYQRIKAGTFPPQHKDGAAAYWFIDEVDAYLEGRWPQQDEGQGGESRR